MELENLEAHLNQISDKDWDKLFSLLPKISETKNFGKTYKEKKIVRTTLNAIDELKVVPVFNWANWELGREILLNSNDYNYTGLDKVTLCKLFTFIIRGDRYNNGFAVECFNNGTMQKILVQLKKEVSK